MDLQEHLLARDFRRQQAQRQVGGLILGVQERPDGKHRRQGHEHVADTVALQRAHHESALEVQRRVQLCGQRQQLFACHQVDLVEYQEVRGFASLQALDDGACLLADAALGIDHQRHHVGILGTLPGRGDHGALEPPLGDAEDARRVDQHDLRAAGIGKIGHGNADHPHAGGLHLGRYDRDLGADQGVDQGRLAGIGRADDGDEARAGLRGAHGATACASPGRLLSGGGLRAARPMLSLNICPPNGGGQCSAAP